MRFFILFFILIHGFAFSQDFCSTPDSNSNLLTPSINNFLISSNLPDNYYVVRINVHVIRRNDGSGGQTSNEVTTALNYLKDDFSSLGICFSLNILDNINNTTLYNGNINTGNYDLSSGKFNDLSSYCSSNAIDIFLFSNDVLNSGSAGNIPSKSLVIDGKILGFNLVSSHNISHEMGHCLGLFHTFHGNQCEPSTNYSTSCDQAGDFVCDTPLDPKRWNVDQNTCVWNGNTCNDQSVGGNINPDNRQIMAYVPASCMDHLSVGQGERMRSHLATASLLQSIIIPNYYYITNALNVNSSNLYDALYTLTLNSAVNVNNLGNLKLRAGKFVDVLPGFNCTSGGITSIQIDNNCSTVNEINNARVTLNTPVSNDLENKFETLLIPTLTLHPNPASNNITISSTVAIQSLSIQTMDGKTIQVIDTKALNDIGNMQVNISTLSNGLYLVIAHSQNGIFTQKLIKN